MNVATRIQPDPVTLALQELRDTPEAVTMARLCLAGRQGMVTLGNQQTVSPISHALCFDAFEQARDVLDDLIFLAAKSQHLDRSDLPSTGEVIDILGGES